MKLFISFSILICSINLVTSQNQNDYLPLKGPLNMETINDPVLNINTYINCIYQDKKERFWFGTVIRGVIQYDGNTLTYFSKEEGLGSNEVRDIVEDEEGNLWFATSEGLSYYDGERVKNFTQEDGLIHNDVWSLMIDCNNKLWIGTYSGVSIYEKGSFEFFKNSLLASDTTSKKVHSIMEDSEGNVWLGTQKGAYKYDGKKLNYFSMKDSLANNAINNIIEDQKGNFWFATEYGGVYQYDGTSFTKLETEKGYEGKNSCRNLYEDKEGNIWFTISGVSTYKYCYNTNNELVHTFKDQSCITHTFKDTHQDQLGRIWFVGWLGVFRYDG